MDSDTDRSSGIKPLGRWLTLVWLTALAGLATLEAANPLEIDAWTKQAVEGDGQAQWQLAQAYEKGDGVGRDVAKALVWLTSAAESGVPEAQYALAENYFKGELGLQRSVPQALEWLRKAALQGNLAAGYRLGEIYFNGYGVEKDYVRAAAAMKQPAMANYSDARVYYGYMAFTGQGMTRDKEKGAAMLRQAANAGQQRALILLWQAYAVGELLPLDVHELQRWLAAGVQDGDLRAHERLGLALYLGQGIDQDREVARPLLQEAAEKGSVPAATALAQEIGEKLSGPEKAWLTEKEREALILRYNHLAHIVAVSGGLTGMETYIRTITQLTPLSELVKPNAAQRLSMGEDLIEALAWSRIYREQGGSDADILAWGEMGEGWLAAHTAAVERVAQKTRDLRKELTPATAGP
ncbi:MAG: sel1 repeat family protein [Cephaloticoccus sp.]|nr:sel1 repeat family protein [Cephaloticoccus sp.]